MLRVQRAKCRLAKEPSSPWRAFLGEVAEALHLYIFLMKPQVPESTALPSLFDMVTNSGGGGGGLFCSFSNDHLALGLLLLTTVAFARQAPFASDFFPLVSTVRSLCLVV